jgi:hypothetical protein
MVEETSPTVKPDPADQRAPLEGNWSAEKTKGKEEGMETYLPTI